MSEINTAFRSYRGTEALPEWVVFISVVVRYLHYVLLNFYFGFIDATKTGIASQAQNVVLATLMSLNPRKDFTGK